MEEINFILATDSFLIRLIQGNITSDFILPVFILELVLENNHKRVTQKSEK